MLVNFRFRDVREIEYLAGMKHGVRQPCRPACTHAVEKDRHQQRRRLIVSHRAARHAVNEERNLLVREAAAIAFLLDHILRSQTHPHYTRSSKITACTVTASPRPTASSPSPVFAFTLTHEASTFNVCARFSRIICAKGRKRGRSSITVASRLTTCHPRSPASHITRASKSRLSASFHCGSRSGK